MRNLKKILALVLALVMSLSLMATAGAADAAASNSETITAGYQTAVDVLKGVKVFNGYSDGTFKPQQTITRAEVAAILYRIATGDVTDAKKDIYTDMANVNFTDLAGANWAKGYINYCSNAELIVGMGDGTFRPSQPISGYATLAMILRALGYDQNNEFKGSGWELRTASKARELGILNNVTGDLGSYATREMVAEILFRAILNETVTYSPMNQNGYQKTGTTLAKQNLSLEEVEGVVVANEYANLDGTSTLATDKTKLDTHAALLDYHTTLDDIGESRLAYIHKGSTVLSIADTGKNNTAESTDYEKNLDDVKTEAGITGNAAGENYINFSKYDKCNSDYKIKYILKYDSEASATAAQARINQASDAAVGSAGYATLSVADGIYTVTRTIIAKTTITGVDLSMMEMIFGKADLINANIIDGEVYVGTQSNTDISDDYANHYSYERFEEEFINFFEEASVSANERGNWVKVIDNDGDGVTDYIFKVVYTVAQISNVKDDTYTLDTKNHTLVDHHPDAATAAEKQFNNVTGEKVVATNGETFERGDIVYYAVIDGKAQTVKCDTVTAQIEKVDHNKLVATTTDGTEYTESQVCEHIEDEAYDARVRNLAGKVSYELYFDRGGYLAAFVKTDKVGDFQLITDGWYNRLKANKEFAVRVYNDETKAQDIVDLTSNGSLFIYDNTSDAIQNNNWGALKAFGVDGVLNVNPTLNRVRTTVAAITADGTILPVENSSVTGRYAHNIIDMVKADGTYNIPLKTIATGNIYYTSIGANTAYNAGGTQQVDVRALDNTIYYVVYPDRSMESGVQVLSYTGYNSGIKDSFESWTTKGYVEDVYAVGTAHKAENNLGFDYYTADVVVIELNNYDQAGELVLVLDDTARFSDVRLRDVQMIDSKGELKTVTINWTGYIQSYTGDGIDNHKVIIPGLYKMYGTSDETIYTLTGPLTAEQIAKENIATGQVKHHQWTANNKYVVTDNWFKTVDGYTNKEGQYDLSDDTPLYYVAYGEPNTVTGYRESVPTVNKVDHETTFADRVNETRNIDYKPYRDTTGIVNHNETYYNYNDVMVYYNSKGAAVYAVAFENQYDNTTKDYAQTLWTNVIPAAAKITAFNVEFYGNVDTDGDKTITVAYDDAVAFLAGDKDALVVEGAEKGWFLTNAEDNQEIVDIETELATPNPMGTKYQLNLKRTDVTPAVREIWTLIISPAAVDNDLYFEGALVSTDVNNPTVYDGTVTTLANVKAQFTKAANAEWTWTVTDADGRPVEDVTDQTIWGDGFKATIVVTAQNGTAKTYYVEFVAGTAVAPTQAERDAAQDEVDAYAPAGIDKVDAAALQAAKDDAAKAIANARTKKALDNAVAAYKAAVDKLIADLPVVEDDVKCAEFENNTKTPFEYTALDGTRVSIPLTVPTGLELVDGKVTVAAGKDGIPAADKITNPGNGDHIVLMIVKNKGTFAEADAADVVTNDLYAETGASITVEAAEGDTLYFYYYMEPGQGGGDDPENPDNPGTDDPVTPPSGGGDISELPPIIELAPVSGRMQTLALDDPAAGEKSGVIWVLVRNDLTPEIGDTSAYKEVKGPFNWTGAEGQEVPSAGVKAKYEQYKEYYNLYYVTYTYEGNVTTTPALAPKEVAIVLNNSIKGAATTENTAVKPGDTVTVTAKDGYIIKEAKVGTTALTVAEDGKSATYTVPADATGTITIDVTVEADNQLTINLKGDETMEALTTASGTEEKITFTIKMLSNNYAPELKTVKDAAGKVLADRTWDPKNVIVAKAETEDGLTYNVTVSKALKGMTLEFAGVRQYTVAVSVVDANKDDFIGKIDPETSQPGGPYVFTFKVAGNKQPKMNAAGTTDALESATAYKLEKAAKPNADGSYDWTLTIVPSKVTANSTFKLETEAMTEVKLNMTDDATKASYIDAANTEVGAKAIVNGEAKYTVKMASEDFIPVVTADTDWTRAYDDVEKVWTLKYSNTSGVTATLSAAPATAKDFITIKCGTGIAEADRTKIYKAEGNGTTVTLNVKLADGYKTKDVTGVAYTDSSVKTGWKLVTITWADINSGNGGEVELKAQGAPKVTLDIDENLVYTGTIPVVGEFSWTNGSLMTVGKAVFKGIVAKDGYSVAASNVVKAADSSAIAPATAAAKQETDGTWTVTISNITPGEVTELAYKVTAKQMYTMTVASTDADIVLPDVKTAPFTGENASVQVKVSTGRALDWTVTGGDAPSGNLAKTVVKTEFVKTEGDYDVYNVYIPFATLKSSATVTLTSTIGSSFAVTVTDVRTNEKPEAAVWFLGDDTEDLRAVNGEATFTVEIQDGYFPKVNSVTAGAAAEINPTPATGTRGNIWTIRVSNVTAATTVTVSVVAGVQLADAATIGNLIGSSGAAAWAGTLKLLTKDLDTLNVEETIDKDGKHYVTVTSKPGTSVGGWIDKTWFDADSLKDENGDPNKTLTDILPSFYPSDSRKATWENLKNALMNDYQVVLDDDSQVVLLALVCPGSADVTSTGNGTIFMPFVVNGHAFGIRTADEVSYEITYDLTYGGNRADPYTAA